MSVNGTGNVQPRVAGRGKTYQVVTEQLHDEGRVLVALLAEGVELCRLR
jgi:hypothetical protein